MSSAKPGMRRYLARYGAPAAFLAAVTAAVLLVRAGLSSDEPGQPRKVDQASVLVSGDPARRGSSGQKVFYVIRAGDTLETVARRFGTSVPALLALNPGAEPTSLRIGQKIRTA